jgi:hypothetical protein
MAEFVTFCEDAIEAVHGIGWRQDLVTRKNEFPIVQQKVPAHTKKYVRTIVDGTKPFIWAIVNLTKGKDTEHILLEWLGCQQRKTVEGLCSKSLGDSLARDIGRSTAWGSEEAWKAILEDAECADRWKSSAGTTSMGASTAAVSVDYAPSSHTYTAPAAPVGPMPCVEAMTAAVQTMQRGIQDDLARQESNRSRHEADMHRRLDVTFREQNEDLDRRLKRSFRDVYDNTTRTQDRDPKRTQSTSSTVVSTVAGATGQVGPKTCLRCGDAGHTTWRCPVPCPECGVSMTGTHINGCKFTSKRAPRQAPQKAPHQTPQKAYHQVPPPNISNGATKNAQGRS